MMFRIRESAAFGKGGNPYALAKRARAQYKL